MTTIYVYVLDTLADWEIGHITSELYSKRFFRKDAPNVTLKTVSYAKHPVKSMGGMTITPDCLIDDIEVCDTSFLLLPGSNAWDDPKHTDILEKAKKLLAVGATVCAICGATAALAKMGLLDTRSHTSNGIGFLEMFCPDYKGSAFYIDEPSVIDKNLITASCTGGLLCAKQIIEKLDVFQPDTLVAWYDYFCTGKIESFYALMQTIA